MGTVSQQRSGRVPAVGGCWFNSSRSSAPEARFQHPRPRLVPLGFAVVARIEARPRSECVARHAGGLHGVDAGRAEDPAASLAPTFERDRHGSRLTRRPPSASVSDSAFQCRTLRARARPTTTPRAEARSPTAVTITAAYCQPSPTPSPHQPFLKPAYKNGTAASGTTRAHHLRINAALTARTAKRTGTATSTSTSATVTGAALPRAFRLRPV